MNAPEYVDPKLAIIYTSVEQKEDIWEHHISFHTSDNTFKLVKKLDCARTNKWIKGLKFDKEKTKSFCVSLSESTLIWDDIVKKDFKMEKQEFYKIKT